MTSEQLRKAYKNYWESSPRNAKEVPNVSLVPNNDPTLLFVNSGMFPLNPYLSGQPHPLGTRLFNLQRCLRTNYDEMMEIGDNRHTLMFEMMGDWSLGDFSKEEQIPWIMEFWVKICGLDPKRLYVSVFEGNEDVARDTRSIEIWKDTFKKYGVEAEFSEDITNIPPLAVRSSSVTSSEVEMRDAEAWKFRIFPYPKKKNWWQRASDAPGELGGPTSEMFYDLGKIEKKQDKYHINDDSGRFIEIGNNVFTEYKYSDDHKWEKMEKNNIDFGGGFERVVMIVQGKTDIFETDLFMPIIEEIEKITDESGLWNFNYLKVRELFESNLEGVTTFKEYWQNLCDTFDETRYSRVEKKRLEELDREFDSSIDDPVNFKEGLNVLEDDFNKNDKKNKKDELDKVLRVFRILADHSRAATFILADGVVPSNKDQGYILRRFIRRLVRYGIKLGIETNFTARLAEAVINKMKDAYPHLEENKSVILDEIEKEEIKFRKTLDKGLKFVEKLHGAEIEGKQAFYIYETFGFPLEMTLDELGINDDEAEKIEKEFKEEETKHREQSRAGAEQKFKGGLADQSVETTKLHTAHHLLLKALQMVLGDEVHQKGSNITGERLRIDFNYGEKLTDEQISEVEKIVNEKIEEGLEVKRVEMPKEEAMNIGAEMEFGQKYPDTVSVYVIGDNIENAFSKEFCGGPHVSNTKEIGEGGKRFKIAKQENVGAGMRRIKGILV